MRTIRRVLDMTDQLLLIMYPVCAGEKRQSEELPMKNAEKIFNIGQWIMILGSIAYAIELILLKTEALTLPLVAVYAVSIVLMLIGWIGTRDERRARKEQQKREAEAAKQSA